MERGEGRPAAEVFEDIRRRYNIPDGEIARGVKEYSKL